MNLLKKIIFIIKKSPIVVIFNNRGSLVSDIIFHLFKDKEILISLLNLKEFKNLEDYKFLFRNSKLPIFIIPPFGEEQDINKKQALVEEICKIIRYIPSRGFIILNIEDGIIRRIKSESSARVLSYGSDGADFLVTDININSEEANFKINYEGNIVPFWLKNISNKEQLYNALSAVGAGVLAGLNMVEISQKLKKM